MWPVTASINHDRFICKLSLTYMSLSCPPSPLPPPPSLEVDCTEVNYDHLTKVTHSPHQCGVLPGLLDNLLSLQVFEKVRGLLINGQDVVSLRQPSLGSTTPSSDLRTHRQNIRV